MRAAISVEVPSGTRNSLRETRSRRRSLRVSRGSRPCLVDEQVDVVVLEVAAQGEGQVLGGAVRERQAERVLVEAEVALVVAQVHEVERGAHAAQAGQARDGRAERDAALQAVLHAQLVEALCDLLVDEEQLVGELHAQR